MKRFLLALFLLGTVFVGRSQTAPEAIPQTLSTNEDTQLSGAVTGTDADNDALTFVQGATSVQHGSLILNADGTFTYTPDLNYNGPDAFSFKAYDGTQYSSEAAVNITVTAVNDAPVANGQSVTLTEDGSMDITLDGVDIDGDALTFTPGTPAHGSLTLKSGTANIYTYVPGPNYNGSDAFTFTANDGTVDSNPATVSITVTAVNDAPTFTLISNQTVAENAGAQSVTNAVTNKSAGPGNESTQTLTLSVSNNNNSLFSAQPAIDATGTLTYKPALDAFGTATVTVNLKDDGGTANGGVDVTTKTFIITVTRVVNAADRKVILNEIYTDPGTGKNEFFELYNTSTNPTPVQLDCYTLVIYYKTSSTNSGFFVIDLPQSTIAAKQWYIGASAKTIKVQSQSGITADFDWSNLGTTGYLKKYKSTGSGYTDVTSTDLKIATDFNNIFQTIQGGGGAAVFLFNQGSYVNGFIAGFGATTSVPSQITGMPTLPVSFASGSCGTGFTINWATITNAEFNTGGGTAGNDNGYARSWDGDCGSWTKTATGGNQTPGKSNVQPGTVQTSILTTAQNIICGTRLDYSVSSADASVFPVDVRIYEDANKNGILDLGDVLFGDPVMITSSSTQIRSVSGLDATKTYLVVYNTALGCSDAILAPGSTPGLTTAQYNVCNKQLGFALTAANQVALAEAFPLTVNFLNNGTQIGNAITVNAPSATPYYTDILPTAFDPTRISIQYVPSSGCLSTVTVANASGTSFTQASGTLLTNEQFVLTNPGVGGSPGKMQIRVTGVTSTTGYNASNVLPLTANLYYDHAPGPGDDVFIESMQLNAFNSTYQQFQKVFTLQDLTDNGSALVVTYTANLSCLTARKEGTSLAALPVHFVSFTATRKDESKVTLNWTTATEQNNKGFYVQRNTGSEWKDVGLVFSQAEGGNSTQELSYSFTDLNGSKGVTQYRILQVDLNGSGHYSQTRSVHGSGAASTLMLFPNPSSTGSVTLVFGSQGTNNVIVSDVSGRTVQQYKGVIGSSLQIKNLSSGFYTVQVLDVTSGTITTEKFIIKK